MLKQFKKNLKCYMSMQKSGEYRYELGAMLECLVLNTKTSVYLPNQIASVLSAYKAQSMPADRLLYDLWGYGYEYDLVEYDMNENVAKDLVALVEMLTGSTYWGT